MADLTDFYPGAAQASPNGAGRPAAPGAAKGGSPAGSSAGVPFHQHPALTVIALVALSLVLLHHA